MLNEDDVVAWTFNGQRTSCTALMARFAPRRAKGAALILPACNSEAMNLHLAEIAKAVEERRTKPTSPTKAVAMALDIALNPAACAKITRTASDSLRKCGARLCQFK